MANHKFHLLSYYNGVNAPKKKQILVGVTNKDKIDQRLAGLGKRESFTMKELHTEIFRIMELF